MDKVFTFSLEENFIQRLSRLIDDEFIAAGSDLSRLAFVFGGKRPSMFLKKELSRRIKKPFLSPVFFSMDEFVDFTARSEAGFTPINDMEAAFLLYSLAREKAPRILEGKSSFAQFLPWAREILSFIEQLDLEDIGLKSLQDVELNAQIGFDIPDSINLLLSGIIGLRNDFHRELKRRSAYTRGMRYLLSAELSGRSKFAEFDKIIFCNLFYLQGAEKKIVKTLYDRDKALLVFQGDPEDFTVLKELEAGFSCRIRPEGSSAHPPEISVYSCFDSQSQAATVRQIVKQIKDPQDTVIVMPSPENIISLLSELSSELKDFNVSLGYPLKRTPIFSLLSAVFRAQKSRKNGKYYTPDYLALLTHPLVKNFRLFPDPAVTRMLAHKIEEILIGMEKTELGGSVFVGLEQIESLKELYGKTLEILERTDDPPSKEELKAALRTLHEFLFYSWEAPADFGDFCRRLDGFTGFLLEKSFLDNYPLNLKMTRRIMEISEELRNSRFSREPFSPEDIFKIFLEALRNEVVAFTGSPLKGLQILGLFETRTLNFRNVIIMDLNESVLPFLKIYEPLIPREVMLHLGINRLEKEEEIQRYQFQRLIRSAEKVFLIFEQGKDKEKSRFIEELVWKKQKNDGSLEALPIPRSAFKVEIRPKKELVEKDGRMLEYLAGFDYSATAINTYLRCPLRFYYQYVLNLEQKLGITEEPEGRQIGNFIHDLLERAFAGFVSRKPVIDHDFKDHFFALLDQGFEETFAKTMKSDSFLLLEIIRFRMEKFLVLEHGRPVKELLMLERKFREKIVFPGEEKEFSFVLKVDRVDKLEDNSLLILDYKTGGAELKPKAAEKIAAGGFDRMALKSSIGSFQLPLYLYFIRRALKPDSRVNACLYNLRLGQLEYFLKDEDFTRLEAIEEVFLKAFGAIVHEIVDPRTAFTADDQDSRYCRNCPFFYLCR